MMLRLAFPLIAMMLLTQAPSALAGPDVPPPPGDVSGFDQGGPAPGGPHGPGREMRAIYDKLSPAGRDILKQHHQAMRAQMERDHPAIKAAHDHVLAAMATDPLDREALRRAFAEENSARDLIEQHRQEAQLALLGKLSAADRKIMADSLMGLRERIRDRFERYRERRDQRR